MCLSPFTMYRPKRSISGDHTVSVPCGKCIECLNRRSNGWTFRLLQEAKNSTSCVFLTLTYDDQNIPSTEHGEPTLLKSDYQDFMKRLRFFYGKTQKPIKYYACGEYGSKTKRPHYHAIIFNIPIQETTNPKMLNTAWGKGHIHIGQGNEKSMRYTCKYIQKLTYAKKEINGPQPEFSLISKGIGKEFLTPQMTTYLKENLQTFVPISGVKTALPRYYKNKIFSERDKKILAAIAKESTEKKMEEHFQNDPLKHHQWVIDQFRKHQNQIRNERDKI